MTEHHDHDHEHDHLEGHEGHVNILQSSTKKEMKFYTKYYSRSNLMTSINHMYYATQQEFLKEKK